MKLTQMKVIENEKSDDSDTVLYIRNRKIKIEKIDSESKSNIDTPQNSNNEEWTSCDESGENHRE